MLNVQAACGCSTGRVRGNNEDNFFFGGQILPQDNSGLESILRISEECSTPMYFGVFDGMGGEDLGEMASYLAASELRRFTNTCGRGPEDILIDACTSANQRICTAAHQHGIGIMGTTAAMLGLDDHYAYAVNIGDSRIYLFRHGILQQISVDHTDLALMQLHGVTNRKPRLTQHLGIEPTEMVIEPAVYRLSPLPGDQYILCSDGLTDMLSDAEIEGVLRSITHPANQVEGLIDASLSHGGKDNVTVISCLVSRHT